MRCNGLILASAAYMAVCSTPSVADSAPYKFESQAFQAADGLIHLDLAFTNLGTNSLCARGGDFGSTMSGPLFRVRQEGGAWLPYEGVLVTVAEDAPVSLTWFGPEQVARVFYNLGENYALKPGFVYEIQFSLPVADCQALVQAPDLLKMPGAAAPFWMVPANQYENWADRLQALQDFSAGWAVHGFFAEMAPATIDLR